MFNDLVSQLASELPNHYIDPKSVADTLERLGKKAAAQKVIIKMPQVKNIRSGDIGEILTADYIDESTDYTVPVRKIWWRDHRNMAMRGDDVIGILFNKENQTINFLKAEAKSNKSLSTDVLKKARAELDLDEGLPAPHALAFVAERLREQGNIMVSDLIEKVQLIDGININQVEHLLFTFTASDPTKLQKVASENYAGDITQYSVGFKVNEHQKLIAETYQGAINVLNN